MVVSGVFGLLDGLLDKSDNLVELLVCLLDIISLTVLDSGLFGEVHAQGVEDVHEVVHVKFSLAMPIIDVADPPDFILTLYFWIEMNISFFQKGPSIPKKVWSGDIKSRSKEFKC